MHEELEEDFRGVIEDVVDGHRWAAYAGPGEAVRRRWRRRRRMLAAGSVGGVAAVVAASVGMAAALAGGGGRAVPAVSGPTAKVVDLTRGLLTAADVGPGFVADHPATDQAATMMLVGADAGCGQVRFAVVSPSAEELFRGTVSGASRAGGPGGFSTGSDEFIVNEVSYQLPAGQGAKAMAAERRQDAVCGAQPGSRTTVSELPGVGAAAYVVKRTVGGRSIVFRVGDVVVRIDLLAGGAGADAPIPGGDAWVAGLAAKAAAAVADAPLIDAASVPGPTVAHPSATPTVKPPWPVSEPADGIMFAPADLGPEFFLEQPDHQGGPSLAGATSTVVDSYQNGATREGIQVMVFESVYHFPTASAAAVGLHVYDGQDHGDPMTPAVALPGVGDQALVKQRAKPTTLGGRLVEIRSGSDVITILVLAGGTPPVTEVPGGDAWIQQIALAAVARDRAGR